MRVFPVGGQMGSLHVMSTDRRSQVLNRRAIPPSLAAAVPRCNSGTTQLISALVAGRQTTKHDQSSFVRSWPLFDTQVPARARPSPPRVPPACLTFQQGLLDCKLASFLAAAAAAPPFADTGLLCCCAMSSAPLAAVRPSPLPRRAPVRRHAQAFHGAGSGAAAALGPRACPSALQESQLRPFAFGGPATPATPR